jgi:hypothetical protein
MLEARERKCREIGTYLRSGSESLYLGNLRGAAGVVRSAVELYLCWELLELNPERDVAGRWDTNLGKLHRARRSDYANLSSLLTDIYSTATGGVHARPKGRIPLITETGMRDCLRWFDDLVRAGGAHSHA